MREGGFVIVPHKLLSVDHCGKERASVVFL
jgi:hypothetical protein